MRPRLQASLIHLAGSLLLAIPVAALVFLVWYPAPLHRAADVTGIVLLIIGIHLIIGPLLTLLVYKAGKKTLRFDLACIVVLQLAALGFGLWVVADGRPAWLVFNVDRFDLVRVSEIDPRRLDEARLDYRRPPWSGPRWVAALNPSDPEEHNLLIFESIMAGVDLPHRPNLYHPLATEAATIRHKAKPMAELLRYNSAEQVRIALAGWPGADAWLPLMSHAPMIVLLNRERAEVVAVVHLKPWD